MPDSFQPSQKFFLYARKSTDVEDKQILSIESQIAELRAFAKQENICVVEELVEKQSAKIPGRPIFSEMMRRIEKGEASGILAWHPDRLARNSVDGGQIIYLLDCGRLTTLKFPGFWFENNSQGKFMLSIAFGQSKYYVDSLSEVTKRGLRQKVRRGEYPSLAPFGYLNDVRTKTVVPDKNKAKFVKQAFELYSKGNSRLEDISNFLAQQGILTRGGKSFKRDKISSMFSNPFYYGYFRYTGELYPGIHEPIIAKKLFDKVQEILKQRSKPKRKEKIPKAFTGLLRCGECEKMVTAEIQKGHIYYRCTKKSQNYRCQQPFIREEDLNRQLTVMMQKVSLRQDWAEWMLNKLKEEEKLSAQSCFAFVQENQSKIKNLKLKLQLLLDSFLDQVVERESYLPKKSEMLSKIKTLEEQTIRFEQKQNDWLEPFQSWIKEAANTTKIAKSDNLFTKKELLLKIFGSNLILVNKKAHGEAQNAWAAIRAARRCFVVEPRVGIEPTTPSLPRTCSAN